MDILNMTAKETAVSAMVEEDFPDIHVAGNQYLGLDHIILNAVCIDMVTGGGKNFGL